VYCWQFQAGTVTNPTIWLVLSTVRSSPDFPISDHGHSNACVSFFREFLFSFESLEKKKKLFTGLGLVRIVKNCDLELENAALGYMDLPAGK